MIEVRGITKVFAGGRRALQQVSFAAQPGGVVGLLGENGAGKTTTMRILSGYLRPTAGSALVCDQPADSIDARRRLGYLPEQVPLHGEMRIAEYLRYRAGLRDLPRAGRRAAIEAAVQEVGLQGHEDRIIGQLSLGFRQRVGLADALLHQPQVLLLDEPTSGLDPNQRREVLSLIDRLGQGRTVLLSTHVLPEVEKVCQRVLLLHRGRLLASGTPAELMARLHQRGKVEVRCRGDGPALSAALSAVPGVAAVEPLPAGGFLVTLDQAAQASEEEAQARIAALARAAVAHGELFGLSQARSDLDAVFRWLTTPGGVA